MSLYKSRYVERVKVFIVSAWLTIFCHFLDSKKLTSFSMKRLLIWESSELSFTPVCRTAKSIDRLAGSFCSTIYLRRSLIGSNICRDRGKIMKIWLMIWWSRPALRRLTYLSIILSVMVQTQRGAHSSRTMKPFYSRLTEMFAGFCQTFRSFKNQQSFHVKSSQTVIPIYASIRE